MKIGSVKSTRLCRNYGIMLEENLWDVEFTNLLIGWDDWLQNILSRRNGLSRRDVLGGRILCGKICCIVSRI